MALFYNVSSFLYEVRQPVLWVTIRGIECTKTTSKVTADLTPVAASVMFFPPRGQREQDPLVSNLKEPAACDRRTGQVTVSCSFDPVNRHSRNSFSKFMIKQKKSETELIASVLKKKIQNTQAVKRTLFNYDKANRELKRNPSTKFSYWFPPPVGPNMF